ncbi:DMT family transporter [Parachryseolinea silvisoli]|uniref:DMT family transporter n=1 Tax=Parachryseolinea silvisoli TaxID=2873601 RepID=UPI0022658CC0|nr:DMT family transporter [Parachryseolinea silvisoli]MCD9014052.1 DMT family transporter [Parachryseolinea silvisoli]
MDTSDRRYILTGLLFSMLWASASVAGKFGLRGAEPLVFFTLRFLLAGIMLLGYVYLVGKSRLPIGKEWKQLTIFGALNTTLYLGLFVVALQYVTPGITTLAIALNPLFISIMSALLMKRRVKGVEWLSIALGVAGVIVAAYPLLRDSQATTTGMLLLAASMVAYSYGSVYYAGVGWQLSRTTINAWQVLLGGILIAPFAWLLHKVPSQFDLTVWLSLAWLIVPVSIGAVQLWLRLLKTDAVRASLWLYLCPVFGFLYAAVLLHEPLTIFTLVGTALVLLALYLGQQKQQQ